MMLLINNIFSFFAGTVILCMFATFQKIVIGAPLIIKGYFVPVVFGGISGLIIGSYIMKLKKTKNKLTKANVELEFRVKERTVELTVSNEQLQKGAIKRKKAEQERVKLEVQLFHARKMEAIGRLAAGVAHEINNPIAFISSNLDVLNGYMKNVNALLKYYQTLLKILTNFNQENLSDEIKKQIQTISEYEKDIEIDYIKEDIPELLHDCMDGSGRIGRIVGDLKSFTLLGKEEQKSIDINKSMESTLTILHNELKDKATVIKDFGEIPMVEGYPQKLNQVFMNILLNATQAIAEKGEIIIQTKKEGDNVVVSISDNGCGIEKNIISKIFDPFFTTKEIGMGTGMGLSVAHGVVTGMRGTIQVNSDLGKGSEFKVYFPIEKKSLEKPNIQTNMPVRGGTEHILLVDDEDAVVTMEKKMLESLGYQVTFRTSTIEALEAFCDNPEKFDLVITDMAMPNMSGEKLSVELTKIRPDIPILLCTGFSEAMSEEKAAYPGIKGFLLKPMIKKDLAKKIREVIDTG